MGYTDNFQLVTFAPSLITSNSVSWTRREFVLHEHQHRARTSRGRLYNITSLSQQVEAGAEFTLMVGKQMHVLYAFPTLPPINLAFFLVPVLYSACGFLTAPLAPIWYRMTEVQWQSCVKENYFPVLINTKVTWFSFFFLKI